MENFKNFTYQTLINKCLFILALLCISFQQCVAKIEVVRTPDGIIHYRGKITNVVIPRGKMDNIGLESFLNAIPPAKNSTRLILRVNKKSISETFNQVIDIGFSGGIEIEGNGKYKIVSKPDNSNLNLPNIWVVEIDGDRSYTFWINEPSPKEDNANIGVWAGIVAVLALYFLL